MIGKEIVAGDELISPLQKYVVLASHLVKAKALPWHANRGFREGTMLLPYGQLVLCRYLWHSSKLKERVRRDRATLTSSGTSSV